MGAAKTLFALRPSLCAPWDDYTLSQLGFDRSAASYSSYLRHVLSQLQAAAAQAGVSIAELPALVGRPDSTPPKLIDEYYWGHHHQILRPAHPPATRQMAHLGRSVTSQAIANRIAI